MKGPCFFATMAEGCGCCCCCCCCCCAKLVRLCFRMLGDSEDEKSASESRLGSSVVPATSASGSNAGVSTQAGPDSIDAKIKERLHRQLQRSLQPKRPLSAFLYFSSDVSTPLPCVALLCFLRISNLKSNPHVACMLGLKPMKSSCTCLCTGQRYNLTLQAQSPWNIMPSFEGYQTECLVSRCVHWSLVSGHVTVTSFSDEANLKFGTMSHPLHPDDPRRRQWIVCEGSALELISTTQGR